MVLWIFSKDVSAYSRCL